MKKILMLALLSLCQMAAAQVSPCNRLCVDLSGCFQGSYFPGIYLGAEMGYAAIQVPKKGCIIDRSHSFRSSNGHFAYGLFAGFNGFTCFNNFFFGFEGGYHNNGYANLNFGSKHHYQLTSYDWGGSATFTYTPFRSVDLFVKLGGAYVTEKLKNTVRHDCHRLIPKLSRGEWAPTVDTGIGYSVWDWLNFSVSYRGVYGRTQNDINHRLVFKNIDDVRHFGWRGISTVHAIYGGLNVMF